jgi:hypothetical protein
VREVLRRPVDVVVPRLIGLLDPLGLLDLLGDVDGAGGPVGDPVVAWTVERPSRQATVVCRASTTCRTVTASASAPGAWWG